LEEIGKVLRKEAFTKSFGEEEPGFVIPPSFPAMRRKGWGTKKRLLEMK
jgi:hypothetical protein